MAVYQMIYVGIRKIYAIKAVKAYCSVGLKEAKDACENESGFLVTPLKAAAILSEYLRTSNNPDNSAPVRRAGDWKVGDYRSTAPIDFTCSEANLDALLDGTGEL